MKNLHHLVEDVVAALHLLLESDPSFFKQVCLDVAPEKYTYANKSPPTNDNYVNNRKLQISPSQFSLGVEVDADEFALDEDSDSNIFSSFKDQCDFCELITNLLKSKRYLTYHEQLSIKQAYESGRVVVTSSLSVAERLKDRVCLHNLVLQGHLEI